MDVRRIAPAAIAAVLVVSAARDVRGASRARLCQRNCGSAIGACVVQGAKRGVCKRRTVKQCKKRGIGLCIPQCGDGLIAPGEACDDGNLVSSDACRADCQLNVCGDGVMNPSAEECDDGNRADGDACRNSCRRNVCGDGVVNAGVEECDDGNSADGDSCRAGCRRNVCGDGIVLAGGEECDDGNTASGDGCEASCLRTQTGLYGLLGTWDFRFVIISAFVNRYRMDRVARGSGGINIIEGRDDFGGAIVAARTQELVPGTSSPYEFALLDPGTIICRFYLFSKSGQSTVLGLYYQTDVYLDGSCGDIISNGYTMNGTRVSATTNASSVSRGSHLQREAAQAAAVANFPRGDVPFDPSAQELLTVLQDQHPVP